MHPPLRSLKTVEDVQLQFVGLDTAYTKWGKRVLDLGLSIPAMLLLLPVFAACGIAVLCDSPGPVLFRQWRVGRYRRPIQILKFRTMFHTDVPGSRRITVGGDRRVTPVGRFLRKFKLDELPQLINVIQGEMSLVGPRPEVEEYVAVYDAEQARVLELKPGITGAASVVYSDEETELARQADSEQYYREVVLPRKLHLELSYARQMSLVKDLGLIIRTALKIVRL
jgi:lipopolysaccharide/colanic/teichoic acid biosynthesis glycosyltransferase